ncbi:MULTISPECIES: hypothetical protein [Sutcliffiella]|uniref:hypothetical protein n=1 Tax=Sutcliffiella TaxID=2837511 RepID=UPI000A56A296|nr:MULTISPECIES: hypothetical protein [Sutcliffiella]WBL14755.1 hypothetical protein O1A01_23245 [Sutcliffiella sp. NC1]
MSFGLGSQIERDDNKQLVVSSSSWDWGTGESFMQLLEIINIPKGRSSKIYLIESLF